METIILSRLEQIQEKEQMKILFSCESGSRGWQFASSDSDYDVRFIYVRPFNYYLSVSERVDNLKFAITDELDIYGWDLRKVLQLIRKSNTTPFEWLQSPVVYMQEPHFRDELWALCQHYFSAKANIHHYLGIAKGAMDTIENNDKVKIKKLFYILRPLLAAKWCVEKETIAPMTIGPLMDLMPLSLQKMVRDLITLKSTTAEGHVISIVPELRMYIEREFIACDEAAKKLSKDNFNVAMLDDFFIKTIRAYDY